MEGWIKLHRKLLDNPIFSSEKGLKIWIWCLLKANHLETDVYLGMEKIHINSGEFIFGRDSASKDLKIKPSTIRNWIELLKKDSYINTKTTNKYTVITIQNWIMYQEKGHEKGQQIDNRLTTDCQRIDTNKNDKNVKNDKNDDYIEEKIPNRLILSRGQLIALAKEFNGLSTEEIKEQRIKCNDYMNISSVNYTNVGLFFKKWLTRYQKEKNDRLSKERMAKELTDNLPKITEEQRLHNLERLNEMRKNYPFLGGVKK